MGISRYGSITEYLDQWSKLPETTRKWCAADGPERYYAKKEWAFGLKAHEAYDRAKNGDPSITENVRMGMDKLDLSKLTEAYGVAWKPSVVGQRVSVGDYLTGNPMCMRRRVKTESNTRHVHVYMELATSAYSKAEEMMARGCAVLGLLEALQAMRVSVDLTLVCDLGTTEDSDPKDGIIPAGTHMQLIKVDTKPLNISESGFAIAHPGFTRIITYSNIYNRGFRGQFSTARSSLGRGWGHHESVEYNEWARKALNLQPTDIYVPMLDPQHKVCKDPAGWIAEKIEQVAAQR